MRVKHKPWARDHILAHPEVCVAKPEEWKGKWHQLFGNENPIHIEIGTGKGQFVTGMAVANPEINYIGIEVVESVIITALDKALAAGIPNLRLLSVDGAELLEYFEPGEVARVYLNFSDPWPKTRHAKRRLTNPRFLDIYKALLPADGEIHFKTDNRGLFEYSLVAFSEYGLLLQYLSLDLHHSDFEGNIMTEYEEKFSAQGFPIYRLEATYKS
ncbi:tRNA (guanosine(46)-N7)-methyltransferase TrmB [Listeria weihenstephanensis]|uniref:tRNA (guanine-N(7)-)-methyltransferase n=1 Tax=Listeria weihenstephanensis TaxID=1006155 RepID=A0A1S7FVA5_9LIST|nr:tRNA (guanosine(46)-N7)-methyltransferase TrmB [Listeria weihenstephanensis]AQY51368.1 tRNA (guanine-N7)-methyltransferase [Listeria weihenstephanensis]MBC1500839.1 tRNA (guanosine(46)-N7)-methyltransferase TrmB [Listeria weihenstephanensis]